MGKLTEKLFTPSQEAESGHPVLEDLARLAEGRVDQGEREVLLGHVAQCSRCHEILSGTLLDLPVADARGGLLGRLLEVRYLAAACLAFVMILGGLLYQQSGPEVINVTVSVDGQVRTLLMESDALVWEGDHRVAALALLLRRQGVQVKGLEKVVLAAPYTPSKSLFGPKEKLRIRIEKGVAHREVVADQDQENEKAKEKNKE